MKTEIIEKIKTPFFDKILEFVSFCFVLTTVVLLWKYFSQLPDLIPTRFHFEGTVKHLESKDFLMIEPLIGAILFVLLFAVSRSYKNFTGISKNAQRPIEFYLNTARMLRWMGVIMQFGIFCSIFGVVLYYIFKLKIFNTWMLPIFLVILLLPFCYYSYKNSKN
jgi:membrane protein insertase Oxa1/YidC/SpoIIIJ